PSRLGVFGYEARHSRRGGVQPVPNSRMPRHQSRGGASSRGQVRRGGGLVRRLRRAITALAVLVHTPHTQAAAPPHPSVRWSLVGLRRDVFWAFGTGKYWRLHM